MKAHPQNNTNNIAMQRWRVDKVAWERQEKWRRDGDGDGGGSAVNQQQKRLNSRSGAMVGKPVSFQRSGDVLEHNPILWLQALSGRATCGMSCVLSDVP